MKKLLVIAVGLLGATSIYAADNHVIAISGTVNKQSSVDVKTPSATLNLTLATAQLVSQVDERSNNKAGYKVSVTTANAPTATPFFLKGAISGNTDQFNYTIKYGPSGSEAAPLSIAGGTALLTSVTAKTSGPVSKNLQILLTTPDANPSNYTADTYSDTITFTVADN